jgi:adenylate cyclase
MAVMFTDLAGFSSWALKAGDEPALALLREVGTRVETAVVRRDGRIIKRLGDGVMATFLSAQAAIDAARDAQDQVGQIEIDGLSTGRAKRLRADGAERDLHVVRVTRD